MGTPGTPTFLNRQERRPRPEIPLPTPVARVVAIHEDQTAARPLRREIGRNLRPLSRFCRERSVTALDAKAFPSIAAATQSEYD